MRGGHQEFVKEEKMRVRLMLIGLLTAVVAVPLGARATEHCDKPIWFLTGTGVIVYTGTVGCEVIAEDLPETPQDESNSDIIVPGAASGIVRWTVPDQPLDGSVVDGVVAGSRIEFNGKTTALRFTRGETLTGEPANYWDSQEIPVGRTASLTGGNAVITVCYASDPGFCETRVYRTVGSL